MRNYNMRSNQVNHARRELGRESRATLRAGRGLVPKVGTALSIYDTAHGAVRTTRAAVTYGNALKLQATARVQTNIRRTTRPIRQGINAINRLLD